MVSSSVFYGGGRFAVEHDIARPAKAIRGGRSKWREIPRNMLFKLLCTPCFGFLRRAYASRRRTQARVYMLQQ